MKNKIFSFIAALFGIGVISVAGAGVLTPGSGGRLSPSFFTSNGTSIQPTAGFAEAPRLVYRNITASTTLALTDAYESVSTASGSITITLPLLSTATNGQIFWIKDRTGNASTSNIVVVTATSTDKVDGATSTKISTNFGSLRIVVGTSGWEVN